MALRGLVGSMVCLVLLTSACNASQKPQESPKPAPAGYCRRPASFATGGPAVYRRHGRDITLQAGITQAPETRVLGFTIVDYNDGDPDLLLTTNQGAAYLLRSEATPSAWLGLQTHTIRITPMAALATKPIGRRLAGRCAVRLRKTGTAPIG